MEDISRLLKEGIQAVKAGQHEQARALLLQVIEADEENERAWLWLSGAVETDEERRICLENVLTINPENALAKKGLARLKPPVEEVVELPDSFMPVGQQEELVDEPISEAFLPPSLLARAAQFEKGEVQGKAEWWLEGAVIEPTAVPLGNQFNDVWSKGDEICAFCAEPVFRTQLRCSKCDRPLIAKTFINAVPGKYFQRLLTWVTIYLAIRLIGIAATLLLANELIPNADFANILTQSIATFVPTLVAAVGLYQRQTWAYWLVLVIAILEVGLLLWLSFGTGSIGFLICMSPIIALALFILFTVYMAGEDFQKMQVWRIAAVSERLKEPNMLDKVAQQLAKEGKWASAVLHWQRAVGHASGHAPYLLRLGHAFAELGFYERSQDILKSALAVARNSETRQEIEQEMVNTARRSQAAKEA